MFNTKRFLQDHFRTPIELVEMFRSYRMTPPREGTASQWFTRASVPSSWFALLLVVLEMHRGGPISIVEYMED